MKSLLKYSAIPSGAAMSVLPCWLFRLFLAVLFLLPVSLLPAQELTPRTLTLSEAIVLARKQSVDAASALGLLKSAYWSYRSFRAELLPEVNFSATLPSYRKNYNAYQQSDGSHTYVRNDYMSLNGAISVDQSIWFTGGTLSLTTSLDYMTQFGTGSRNHQFMSVPVALTLNQPLFGVNSVKWDRRIEPLRYAEAQANFLSATERVTMTVIQYYFNLLLARENVSIARQNLQNAEKLCEVAESKRRMGKISENDLLQLRLNVLNARSTLTANESSLKSNMFTLRSFLALGETEELIPVLPDSVPPISLEYHEVLKKALEHNSISYNLRRRQLEADYQVAQAKGNRRQVSLYAQVGFTGSDSDFGRTYTEMKDNQVVQVGVQVPILDWGKRRGQVKVAESNREVVRQQLRKEEADFSQSLFVLTEQFNNQVNQLQIALEADAIARRRYQSNVETFLIGKISTLDLNDAQTSKDEARRKYINELFSYWYYYYQIRSITLWDFAAQTNIDADFEEIVR